MIEEKKRVGSHIKYVEARRIRLIYRICVYTVLSWQFNNENDFERNFIFIIISDVEHALGDDQTD